MALGGKDVLRLVVDADSSGAIREFDKLGKTVKSTVGDVEKSATGLKGKLGSAFDGLAQKSPMVSSALQKMGISGQQAGAMIASAIPMAAVAAGGAIAAFAAKGVSDFQQIALAAGKFSDASGLSVEQASKWIEVADHIGVSEGAVSSAFRRMGVAIGNNTKGWSDLNVQVVKNQDGSLNLSDTFLKAATALQSIEDPTKRAAAAQKLFGKGYAEVAELIGRSAPELAAMLNEVGDAKIITPEELEKARAFRGAMDDLGDSVQEAGIMLGQQLVPQLTKLAGYATTGIKIAVEISGLEVGGGFNVGDIASEALTAINPMQRLTDVGTEMFNRYRGGAADVKAATAAVTEFGGGMAQMSRIVGDNGMVLGSGFAEMSKNAAEATENNFKFGGSADAVAQNVGDEASALRDANDALGEHADALLATFDANFAVGDAARDYNKALTDVTETEKDGKATSDDLTGSYEDAEKAALKVAQAHVTQAQKTAEASGKTLTASQSNEIMIGTLFALAQTATGPVQAALLGMVGQLQTVGAQKPKPTVGLDDQATVPLNTLISRSQAFDGSTYAATFDGNFTNINSKLSALSTRLSHAANSGILPSGRAGFVPFAHGGAVGGSRGVPMPAIVHGGEYVLSADVVDRIKQGRRSQGAEGSPGPLPIRSNGGGATVVNMNGTFLGSRAEFGRLVDEALAESRRRGNKAS